ncbi:MAG: AtpZ/AtpI family protein [Chloroflexi bacterium]|nr:AtpZ/AtpI family protein [Chloroflexota bacterium]
MKRWEAAARLIGLGWYVGASIFLGVIGGIWLDNRLNSKPVFVILGLLLGIIVAFYGLYKMILPNLNNRNKARENEGKR